MRKLFFSIAVACGILLFSGCELHRQQLALNMFDVQLGMEKGELVRILGRPNMVVSAYTAGNGDRIEIWEYLRSDRNSITEQMESRPVWTYFVNNELFEWGPGENWEIDAAFRREMLSRSQDYKTRRSNR